MEWKYSGMMDGTIIWLIPTGDLLVSAASLCSELLSRKGRAFFSNLCVLVCTFMSGTLQREMEAGGDGGGGGAALILKAFQFR